MTDLTIPFDLEAEESLIGAMFQGPNATRIALEAGITCASFHKPEHGTVFDAIVKIVESGASADVTTVAAALNGALERIGGRPALLRIEGATPASSNARAYARIVRQMECRRQVIAVAADLSEAARAGGDHLDDLIASLEPHKLTGGYTSTLRETDMTAVGMGPKPTILTRNDGKSLLYVGTNDIHGPPGIGKTLVLDVTVAQALNAGGNVLLLDYESNGTEHKERLIALGIAEELVNDRDRFRHFTPEGPLRPQRERAELEATLLDLHPDVIGWDAMGGALTMDGYDENVNADYFRWRAAIAAPLAAYGGVHFGVDHVSRDPNRTRGARGAGAKLQGLTGASYEVVTVHPFARDQPGTLKLVVAKDRFGHVGAIGTTAAFIDITPHHNGQRIDVTIRPGGDTQANDDNTEAGWRPTILMERASRKLESLTASGDLPSRDSLSRSVTGKHMYLKRAIDQLLEDGYAEREGKVKIRSVRPYRRDEGDTQ